jgi:hypothetical protein
MLDIRVSVPDAPRLVEALLVAGGAIPVPTDPTERKVYLALANSLGDGLDTLPKPAHSAKPAS